MEEVEKLFEGFHDLVTADPASPAEDAGLGKLAVFAGVREFPVRVKCATLAWHTLRAALHGNAACRRRRSERTRNPLQTTTRTQTSAGNRQPTTSAIRERVIEQLRTVFDPEIPVNIYELGLIYDVNVDDAGQVGDPHDAHLPDVPGGRAAPAEVETKVRGVAGVCSVQLELVWDPAVEPEHDVRGRQARSRHGLTGARHAPLSAHRARHPEPGVGEAHRQRVHEDVPKLPQRRVPLRLRQLAVQELRHELAPRDPPMCRGCALRDPPDAFAGAPL